MRYYFNKSKSNFANRGMVLENDINVTNEYYIEKGIALIYKKPTPIKITKVNYDKSKITEAFFESPSTLDYNGLYKGKYIKFDAKETQSKTSFALANIHNHQLEHIKKVYKLNGLVFLIIRFVLLNETYILIGRDLLEFIDNNNRKSIPYSYIKEKGYIIELKYLPRLDYLKVLDRIMED